MTITKNFHHHLIIDIENAACTPSPEGPWVSHVQETLRDVLELTGDELVTVGCSHHAARTVAFAWQGGRRVWRSGPDGADLALLEVLEHELMAGRCEELTVVSGDAIFSEALAAFGALGIPTTVAAVRGHLASRSRFAAQQVIELDPWWWVASDLGVA
jgi:hypothetical protein